jgi:N-acetylglucosamine kinase-like BadF-type ATPase
LPKAVLGHGRYTCGNDMICGWAGSLGGGDGISITAGTGSIGYGETGGRSARSGGWGELFGDEGSAYWVAIRGLALFSRMADGRAPPGPLLDVFRTAFALKSDLDLSGVVTADYGGERDRIAGLCPLVVAAAQQGDPAAAAIFAEAAGELALLALAIRNGVGYGSQDLVPVSTAGGLFDAGDLIMSPFRAALANLGRFSLIAPIYDSSMGAAIYAIRLARVAPT